MTPKEISYCMTHTCKECKNKCEEYYEKEKAEVCPKDKIVIEKRRSKRAVSGLETKSFKDEDRRKIVD